MARTTRLLLVSLVTFAVTLALVSVGYGRHAAGRYGPERTFARAVASGENCILTIGDSRTLQGVDVEVLTRELEARGTPRCVAHLAIGALRLPGQVIALRRYLEVRRPSVIVLGVSDGTLVPPESYRDPSEMVGNHAVELLWSNAEERAALHPDRTLRALDARLRHALLLGTSLGSYGSLAWLKVQTLQEQVAGTVELPRNRFGRVADMAALERTFQQGALAALTRWDGRFRTNPWFERALVLATRHRVPVLIVSVPMRSGYRRVVSESPVGRRYDAWLKGELARREGVRYLDLSTTADDGAFIDGVHLGADGARAFSAKLAETLATPGRPGSDP
jgi:hypothetical protein